MGHAVWKKEDKDDKELIGYMFGVDYGYHLGNDALGTTVYKDIQDLYDSHRESQKNVLEDDKYPGIKNFPQDGIVKVRIEFLEHIPAEDCWDRYLDIEEK